MAAGYRILGEKERLDPRGREVAFRVLFTLMLLGLVHLDRLGVDLGAEVEYSPLYILAAAYLLYAAVTYFLYGTMGLKGTMRAFTGAVDIAFFCAALHFCGGVESYLFLFLGIAPLIGGIYDGYRGAVYTFILSAVFYGAVAALDSGHPAGYDLAQALAFRYLYLIGATAMNLFVIDLLIRDRGRLKVFYEISVSSSKSHALYNVLKEMTQRLAELTRAEVATVFLYNEKTGTLEAQQPSLGLDFMAAGRLRLKVDDPGVLTDCFRQGKAILVTRSQSRDMAVAPFHPDYEVFDLVACPLAARGKGIGVLVLANKLGRRGFGRRDLEMVELLSPHVSVFLDNALLYRRSEEKVAQLTSLIRVVDAINTVSSLDQLYNLALDVIRGLFAAEKALINIVNLDTGLMETVRSFGFSAEYVERHLSHPFKRSGGCYVLDRDEAYQCGDIATESRCSNMAVDPRTRSVLCVPIRAGKKIYGILHMASSYRDAFDDEDVTLAKAIGEQIGMAVESARLFEEISRLAITDELTGLYNIRHLKRVLGEEVKRSLRYERPLSFIMLDIDYFKNYNDRHGHLRGDEVLRLLAGLLMQNTRDVDSVFRYGGEEFSVIIPEVEKREAMAMAERIRRVIQDHVFPFEEDQPGGNLTVSMGVANLPEDAFDAEELIDMADRALYHAKQSGRNRVCAYGAGDGFTYPRLHGDDAAPAL
ncbi:MAG: sensor domain-containing diguanylate cyclase [Actinomycetota bacterium]|nr:sensor domain-containing diguanylate cyclase [Actinomycetota bacterium]